ncbi:MAG: ion transporter [Chitinispirillaceae bacterium]|nr:ion transporter [Chitinispirillaceae bacterium]
MHTNPNNSMEKKHSEFISHWRQKLYDIIFESDTFAGKTFDIVLLIAILLSVVMVILESVAHIRSQYKELFLYGEWFFTLLFTVEYILRLACIRRPAKYAFSFYGLIDFIAIVPAYLEFFNLGISYFLAVRIFRLMRVFRIFKLSEYLFEAMVMQRAIKASLKRISVFLLAILTLVVIIGAVMYVVEEGKNGFTDILISIYWAIVTLTTVGYGDIAPGTVLGKMLAAIVMLLGYGLIAVPTGIVTVELSKVSRKSLSNRVCASCGRENHDSDAAFCKFCGAKL